MVNNNEYCRKDYVLPKMRVIEIYGTDIIATSNPKGETDPWEED